MSNVEKTPLKSNACNEPMVILMLLWIILILTVLRIIDEGTNDSMTQQLTGKSPLLGKQHLFAKSQLAFEWHLMKIMMININLKS